MDELKSMPVQQKIEKGKIIIKALSNDGCSEKIKHSLENLKLATAGLERSNNTIKFEKLNMSEKKLLRMYEELYNLTIEQLALQNREVLKRIKKHIYEN